MQQLGLLCGCLLAVVLGSSGLSKLLDLAGSRAAAADLVVPAPRLSGSALPFVEIAVAAALLTEHTSRVGASCAAVLLAALTAVVARALRQGRRPVCHCFGALSGEPVSGRTIVRNLALLAAALLAWWSPGIDGLARTYGTTRTAAAASLGGALAALLLHREGRATRRQDRASRSGAAPWVRLRSVSGRNLELPGPGRGRPVLLLFLSPGCGPCRRLGPSAAYWARAFADTMDVHVVASCDADQARAEPAFAEIDVFLDADGQAHRTFGAPRTPAAALVLAGGKMSEPAEGEAAIRRLLTQALGIAHSDTDQDAEPLSLGLGATPGPRPAVTLRPLPDGGGLLVDEATGAGATVEKLGALLWSLLDGRSSLAEIATDVAEAFGAPEERVEADLLDLVRSLGAAGLLAGVKPLAHDRDVPRFDLSSTA